MLNYVKVASRSLAKNRFFTIINVLGLAVGMSVSLLLIAMLSYLRHYDEFHANKENIYRIITETGDNISRSEYAASPLPVAEKVQAEAPGIQKVVRINKSLSSMATVGNNELPLNGYFADENFLSVFSFPLSKGNPTTALSRPNSILITESAAQKAFGDADAFGKIITMGTWGDFEVTGVLKDHPKASHMQFEVIASYSTFLSQAQDDYLHALNFETFRNNYTYVLLNPSAEMSDLQGYLNNLQADLNRGSDKLSTSYHLQPLEDIVPGKALSNQIGPEWDYTSFSIFGILTLMILIPACFNYTNISISRTLKRAKEIGLRKTVGGQRSQIFFQFITETIIVSLLALAGAFLIFSQARSQFLGMLVANNAIELIADMTTILYFLGFAIIVGLFAGMIPALYFSRINPVQAIKNTSAIRSVTKVSFQKALVISQFALSLGFIMGIVIVLKQYRATLNYNFGFTHASILDVELQDANIAIFKNEFSKLSAVKDVSFSSGIIGINAAEETYIKAHAESDSVAVSQFFIDDAYLSNLNIELIAGTAFPQSESEQYRERYIIVNEEFLKSFKIASAENALDRTFILEDSVEVQIKGVVKNFHYTSLREPIKAFMFRNDPDKFTHANLKLATTDMKSSIEDLQSTWHLMSGLSFKSRFFDDEIEDAYIFYFTLIKMCGFLGFLAITISCLGLLGMVVYSTESRMKELGVRKVMGASSYQLAVLLSKGYIGLMLVAAAIAIPITYILFDRGLLQFQYYRFEIGISEIVISLFILVILGGATILSQTIKASRANPVETLKSE